MAGDIVWPDLPKKAFVKGRPATLDDVRKGSAVFALRVDGKAIGRPIDIEIPQYGIYTNEKTKQKILVIVIQAEAGQGMRVAGIRLIGVNGDTSKKMVVLLKEVKLLGKQKQIK